MEPLNVDGTARLLELVYETSPSSVMKFAISLELNLSRVVFLLKLLLMVYPLLSS